MPLLCEYVVILSHQIAVDRVKSIITRLTAAVLSDIYRLPIGDWLIQPVLGGGDASFVSNLFMRM